MHVEAEHWMQHTFLEGTIHSERLLGWNTLVRVNKETVWNSTNFSILNTTVLGHLVLITIRCCDTLEHKWIFNTISMQLYCIEHFLCSPCVRLILAVYSPYFAFYSSARAAVSGSDSVRSGNNLHLATQRWWRQTSSPMRQSQDYRQSLVLCQQHHERDSEQ